MMPSIGDRTSAASSGRRSNGPDTTSSMWAYERAPISAPARAPHTIHGFQERVLPVGGLGGSGDAVAFDAEKPSPSSSNSSDPSDGPPKSRRKRRRTFRPANPAKNRKAIGRWVSRRELAFTKMYPRREKEPADPTRP